MPNPTTIMPVTEPPLNATFSAAASPLYAACVVRTLDRTVTIIPIYPANAEPTAPITKPIAVHLPRKNNSTVITAPTIATDVYSRLRKAVAPSRTASEIACMHSLPLSCLRTQDAVIKEYKIPITPHPKAKRIILLIFPLLFSYLYLIPENNRNNIVIPAFTPFVFCSGRRPFHGVFNLLL